MLSKIGNVLCQDSPACSWSLVGKHDDPNHSSHEGDGNEIKQRSCDKDYCSFSFFLEPFPNEALEIKG
jgi:hypothetical protein